MTNNISKPTILFSAPYMIPSLSRFRPILEEHGLELIVPEVYERLGEDELLEYAGEFDGTICGDDHYTARVLEGCARYAELAACIRAGQCPRSRLARAR